MSWGAFWMYYKCPQCGKTFKNQMDSISEPDFGHCVHCDIDATFVGESGAEPEGDLSIYIER